MDVDAIDTAFSEDEITAIIALIVLLLLKYKENMNRNSSHRQHWVHPMNESRQLSGVYAQRILPLREFPDRFFGYFRMAPNTFDYLLEIVRADITKQDTFMRMAVPAEIRLAITLHHLAEGASHSSIAIHYALGRSTISEIIYETCTAIYQRLQPIYIPEPNINTWKLIANQFWTKWNFPNCIGALDGKHIQLQAPPNSGTMFFNYKKTFSVNLMAVVDATYKFVVIDVGQMGSASDSNVFEGSVFGDAFLKGEVIVPPPVRLPGSDLVTPHVIVGDEGFPLRPNLMRPFAGRDMDSMERKRFNYRLSRARRVSENAFGILAHRWRILFKPINADANKAPVLILACCALHNFLCSIDNSYNPPGYADAVQANGEVRPGQWRVEEGRGLANFRAAGRNHTREATATRNTFAEYFSSEAGSVDWQDDLINRR